MSQAEYYEGEMKRLLEATPEAQKKDAQFWMGDVIYRALGCPEIYMGFPVKTNKLLKVTEAFIINGLWDGMGCDLSTDETPVK